MPLPVIKHETKPICPYCETAIDYAPAPNLISFKIQCPCCNGYFTAKAKIKHYYESEAIQ